MVILCLPCEMIEHSHEVMARLNPTATSFYDLTLINCALERTNLVEDVIITGNDDCDISDPVSLNVLSRQT